MLQYDSFRELCPSTVSTGHSFILMYLETSQLSRSSIVRSFCTIPGTSKTIFIQPVLSTLNMNVRQTSVCYLPSTMNSFFRRKNGCFTQLSFFFQLGVCWNHIIRRNTIDKFAYENCYFKAKRIRFLFFGKSTNGKNIVVLHRKPSTRVYFFQAMALLGLRVRTKYSRAVTRKLCAITQGLIRQQTI